MLMPMPQGWYDTARINYGTVVEIMHATFTSFRISERRTAGSPSINCTAFCLSEKGRGWGGPRKTSQRARLLRNRKPVCLFVCLFDFFCFYFAHLSKQTIAEKAAVAEPRACASTVVSG